MNIAQIEGVVEVTRDAKTVIAALLQESWVASTCGINGGVRSDLTAIYNHQSCEPAAHHERIGSYLATHQEAEHERVCRENGLDPATTAGMGTAASMRCLGIGQASFRELTVLAVATAGVAGNAGRAGDPAGHFEWDGRYEALSSEPHPEVGTINTMLFFSHELKPGTLLRSLMTATEAKTTVLEELVIGSRYSSGKATGTGTDQFSAACPIGQGPQPLSAVGKHSKLGQLVAETVREAISGSLLLQNGLAPITRRSVHEQLARFGYQREALLGRARKLLEPADAALFAANYVGVDADPLTVSFAAGYAAALDQLASGVLPASCSAEIQDHYARAMAVAASGGAARSEEFDNMVATSAMTTVYNALVSGFAYKWRSLHAIAQQESEQ